VALESLAGWTNQGRRRNASRWFAKGWKPYYALAGFAPPIASRSMPKYLEAVAMTIHVAKRVQTLQYLEVAHYQKNQPVPEQEYEFKIAPTQFHAEGYWQLEGRRIK